MIIKREENIKGLSITDNDFDDFRSCIMSGDLVQIHCKGSHFTQQSNKAGDGCFF